MQTFCTLFGTMSPFAKTFNKLGLRCGVIRGHHGRTFACCRINDNIVLLYIPHND